MFLAECVHTATKQDPPSHPHRAKRQSVIVVQDPPSHRVACTMSEERKTACLNGRCYALDMGEMRTPFCQSVQPIDSLPTGSLSLALSLSVCLFVCLSLSLSSVSQYSLDSLPTGSPSLALSVAVWLSGCLSVSLSVSLLSVSTA